MPAVTTDTTITAADYNDIRTRLLTVCSTYGLDSTLINTYLGSLGNFNAVASGNTIDDNHWDRIFAVLYWLRVHQEGSADPGLPTSQPSGTEYGEGDPIKAGDGYLYDSNGIPIAPNETLPEDRGYNDLLAVLEEAEGKAGVHAATQFQSPVTQGTAADTSTTNWGGGTYTFADDETTGDQRASDNDRGKITREFNVTFPSSATRDRFFAMGGEVYFYVRMTNSNGVPLTSTPSGAKAAWWYNHLNVNNPLDFSLGSSIFSLLTTSYQQFRLKTESSDSLYEVNNTAVELKKNSANTTVTVRITCFDNDRALTEWPDEPVDESVGQRVASWVGLKNITSGTNPLFNTVGCIPSVTNVTEGWEVGAIAGQPALISSPTVPSTTSISYGLATANRADVGQTFTVPAENWMLQISGNGAASGNVDTAIFGSIVTDRDYAGDCRWRLYEGTDATGTLVYDTGILFGRTSGGALKTFSGIVLKSGAASKTYYARFTSYVDGNARAGGLFQVNYFFNGFA